MENEKIKSLKKTKSFNKRSKKVKDKNFLENKFFDSKDLVQVKYEMLRKVSHEKLSISEVSKSYGFSRPSFYEAKNSFEQNGLIGLIPKKTGPQKARKLTEDIVDFIVEMKNSKPIELIELIKSNFNISVHQRTIERALSKRKKKSTSKKAGKNG